MTVSDFMFKDDKQDKILLLSWQLSEKSVLSTDQNGNQWKITEIV